MIPPLLKHIRTAIYIVAFVSSGIIYRAISITYEASTLATIRTVQIYGLVATFFLYITLLISPLYKVFPSLPGKVIAIKARKALGISAFYFGLLHGGFAFFKLLGGFEGLGFVSTTFLYALILSFLALIILLILSITSLEYCIKILGTRWKIIHRLAYVAGVLILVHALMIGTHFNDLSRLISQLFLYAIFVLFILEALRFDLFYQRKYPIARRFSLSFILCIIIISVFATYIFLPPNLLSNLNIHIKHTRTLP